MFFLCDVFWIILLFLVYFIGVFFSYVFIVGVYDICYNILFGNGWFLLNRFFGILVNLLIGIFFLIVFKKYYFFYYCYMGVEEMDFDLLISFEV